MDLKARLLVAGEDEAVSVNQRALIEKILARYSGEFTVFRELLQNADDASAANVEIHFRSGPSSAALVVHDRDALPDLKTFNITSILARNDGMVFRDEDWGRLKKIAEGNPDETKIGAFGVGFSLFSLCDEPVVSSGAKLLGFYWKDGGDQLYVKTAVNAPDTGESLSPDGKPWTSFLMELREPAPIPEPHEFARFLSTCLGFTVNINSVSMHFDSHLLCRISKQNAPSRALALRSNLPSMSPLKILRVMKIEEVPLQLRAEVSLWLSRYAAAKPRLTLAATAATVSEKTTSFASKMLAAFSGSRSSSPASTPPPHPPSSDLAKLDPFAFNTATLFLRTVSAELKVTPSSHFAAEMVRATKKGLPASTVFSLIWTGKDEIDAGREEGGKLNGKGVDGDGEARRVFAGLMSDLDQNGRVYIGFPTFQTTGCAASFAARFVSTVERESIDFQARHVADWNRELLWAGGVLARTVYEAEMADISKLYGKSVDHPAKLKLEERALHLMRFFTFSPSTPSPVVGAVTETSFFTSLANTSITIISQLGPLPASQVRLPNPALAGFLKEVPTIPPLFEAGAPRLLTVYREKSLVRDISLEDVLGDLAAHPLAITECVLCFKWWLGLAANRSYNASLLTKLKDAAMLSFVPEGADAKDIQIHPLGAFKTFLNPSTVPTHLPLPVHTLPFSLTKTFTSTDLVRVFQYEELGLVDWAKHLVSPAMVAGTAKLETNLLLSPQFAEKVLLALSKAWASLSASRQLELAGLLSSVAFIPTRQGPRIPGDTYFSNVDLFADLPIVTLPSGTPVKGALEKLLTALGVRRHVELQMVFTRLLGQGDWSHCELTKYLVGVKETLSTNEVDRLKQTAWMPKEGEATVSQPPGPDGSARRLKVIRYSARQLYEPTETLRELGLPLLDWTTAPQKWRSGSEEARFLFELGLLRAPSVEQILQIAATPGNAREKALVYFLDEYSNNNYGSSYTPLRHALPFLPAMKNGISLYAKPNEVYSNPAVALLGFPVVLARHQQDAARLKLAVDPPPAALVAALVQSPPSIAEAPSIFAYLSTQVPHFSSHQIATLRAARIVPILASSGKTELKPPSLCFFSTDPSLPPGLKTLFTCLPDFGLAAKPFLVSVGVKESPSTSEIASMVLANPGQILDLSGSAEKYLTILRTMALNFKILPSSIRTQMKTSAFFLGTKRVQPVDDDDDDDAAAGSLSWELARASSLVINDEPHTFRVFQAEILACPPEESLEDFAIALGASRISALVARDYRTTGEPDEGSKRAVDLRRTVAERIVLFLSERQQQYGKGDLTHDADWISSHLHVFEVRSIELILTFVGRLKRAQPAAAYVKLAPNGDLHLFVSPDEDLFYETAQGLCQYLLKRQRPNDVLLAMTVLQTSLKNLKRRGYNVDRILNARQAARDAAEARLLEERRKAHVKEDKELSGEKLALAVEQLSELFPDADPIFLRQLLASQQPPHVENAANTLISTPYPRKTSSPGPTTSGTPPPIPSRGSSPMPASSSASSSIHKSGSEGGLMSQLKNKLRPEPRPDPRSGGSEALEAVRRRLVGSGSAPQIPSITRPQTGSTSTAGSTPTSTDAIRSNVAKAVQAARPEPSNDILNETSQTQVRESQSSYCDSTSAANLHYVQDVGGVRFYADHAIPDPNSFVNQNEAPLLRFVLRVLVPVGQVFTVDPRSIHIFHDLTGPLIAFNRGGSLYFNFRYYLAWHDTEVLNGEEENALISTFHSMAHELAHNLVQPHDAQHSFYFSSLCETYFMRMSQLLTKAKVPPR